MSIKFQDMMVVLSALFISTSALADSSIPWQKVIECQGPSGSAVIDQFAYSVHGMGVFQNQLVIRSQNINHYFADHGALSKEAAEQFPNETIISLSRNPNDKVLLPSYLFSNTPTVQYQVKVTLPSVTISAISPFSGSILANWSFVDCFTFPYVTP